MKIFNLVITTEKELIKDRDHSYKIGFDAGISFLASHILFKKQWLVSEVKRLKQDSWDKDGFDRVIDILEKSPTTLVKTS